MKKYIIVKKENIFSRAIALIKRIFFVKLAKKQDNETLNNNENENKKESFITELRRNKDESDLIN